MLNRKPIVGGQIDAWCGSCKVERSHTIAAIDPDGSVSRVTCAYCGSNHRYRSPASASSNGARPRRTATPKQAAVSTAAARVVRNYDRSQRYAVGELIEHPKYGRGTIVDVPAPTKIMVDHPDQLVTQVDILSTRLAARVAAVPASLPETPRRRPPSPLNQVLLGRPLKLL